MLLEENVWETLPVPLIDLFVQEIVNEYLEVEDLVHLSGVSHRYRIIFRCKPALQELLNKPPHEQQQQQQQQQQQHGPRILASMLRRDAVVSESATFRIREQLPSIGNLSVEESIEHDPLTVAQMRKAALRRRKLILIESMEAETSTGDSTDAHVPADWKQQLQPILDTFKPTSLNQMVQSTRQYLSNVNPTRMPLEHRTEFICINVSGEDLYCHWIDDDGDILPRDGDHLPTAAATRHPFPLHLQPSFDVEHNTGTEVVGCPPHIFCHATVLSHAFAICRQQGGPPLAIYQSRRVWHWLRGYSAGSRTHHVHSIVILPGIKIQELHCNSTFSTLTHRPPRRTLLCSYSMIDRSSGATIPKGVTEMTSSEKSNNEDGVADAFNRDGNEATTSAAKSRRISDLAILLAKEFYGDFVPSVQSGSWEEGPRAVRGLIEVLRGSSWAARRVDYSPPNDTSLSFPSVLSETIWN